MFKYTVDQVKEGDSVIYKKVSRVVQSIEQIKEQDDLKIWHEGVQFTFTDGVVSNCMPLDIWVHSTLGILHFETQEEAEEAAALIQEEGEDVGVANLEERDSFDSLQVNKVEFDKVLSKIHFEYYKMLKLENDDRGYYQLDHDATMLISKEVIRKLELCLKLIIENKILI